MFVANTYKNTVLVLFLTFVVGGKAENIIVVLVLVSQPIVPNAWHCVLATTGFSGGVDGILDCAIRQPASIAPVHPSPPRVIQLVKRCHDGILIVTRTLCIVEIKVVASQAGVVWEDNTYTDKVKTENEGREGDAIYFEHVNITKITRKHTHKTKQRHQSCHEYFCVHSIYTLEKG